MSNYEPISFKLITLILACKKWSSYQIFCDFYGDLHESFEVLLYGDLVQILVRPWANLNLSTKHHKIILRNIT